MEGLYLLVYEMVKSTDKVGHVLYFIKPKWNLNFEDKRDLTKQQLQNKSCKPKSTWGQ